MSKQTVQAQLDEMKAMMAALMQENAALKANKPAVKVLPTLTCEGQIVGDHILIKLPIVRERYSSDKGKSGTTLATTGGFNKSMDVAGLDGVKAVIRVYQPD